MWLLLEALEKMEKKHPSLVDTSPQVPLHCRFNPKALDAKSPDTASLSTALWEQPWELGSGVQLGQVYSACCRDVQSFCKNCTIFLSNKKCAFPVLSYAIWLHGIVCPILSM